MAELVPTFLGAHSLPEEARSSESARKRYVDLVVDAMLPAVAAQKLAAFCDIFVERGAFTVDEARRVLGKARELGLGLKVHAEQLTCTGAAELAGEYGAASAEHLEYVSEAGLAAMAKAGTVAVLLPGAAWFLRDVPAQSARFRDAGVRMAVASDHNPGTSPTDRLLLMAQMQILSGGMTLDEALLAVTAHAADALSLGHDRGRLKPGYRADLAVFRARDHRELLWRVGGPPCSAVVKDGVYHRVEGARTSTLFGR
jgi:imidazolonepropionase